MTDHQQSIAPRRVSTVLELHEGSEHTSRVMQLAPGHIERRSLQNQVVQFLDFREPEGFEVPVELVTVNIPTLMGKHDPRDEQSVEAARERAFSALAGFLDVDRISKAGPFPFALKPEGSPDERLNISGQRISDNGACTVSFVLPWSDVLAHFVAPLNVGGEGQRRDTQLAEGQTLRIFFATPDRKPNPSKRIPLALFQQAITQVRQGDNLVDFSDRLVLVSLWLNPKADGNGRWANIIVRPVAGSPVATVELAIKGSRAPSERVRLVGLKRI